MTTRELREILFSVENQELTVRELRSILFDVVEQDEEIKSLSGYELSKLVRR